MSTFELLTDELNESEKLSNNNVYATIIPVTTDPAQNTSFKELIS
jgi:hypothetical protein